MNNHNQLSNKLKVILEEKGGIFLSSYEFNYAPTDNVATMKSKVKQSISDQYEILLDDHLIQLTCQNENLKDSTLNIQNLVEKNFFRKHTPILRAMLDDGKVKMVRARIERDKCRAKSCKRTCYDSLETVVHNPEHIKYFNKRNPTLGNKEKEALDDIDIAENPILVILDDNLLLTLKEDNSKLVKIRLSRNSCNLDGSPFKDPGLYFYLDQKLNIVAHLQNTNGYDSANVETFVFNLDDYREERFLHFQLCSLQKTLLDQETWWKYEDKQYPNRDITKEYHGIPRPILRKVKEKLSIPEYPIKSYCYASSIECLKKTDQYPITNIPGQVTLIKVNDIPDNLRKQLKNESTGALDETIERIMSKVSKHDKMLLNKYKPDVADAIKKFKKTHPITFFASKQVYKKQYREKITTYILQQEPLATQAAIDIFDTYINQGIVTQHRWKRNPLYDFESGTNSFNKLSALLTFMIKDKSSKNEVLSHIERHGKEIYGEDFSLQKIKSSMQKSDYTVSTISDKFIASSLWSYNFPSLGILSGVIITAYYGIYNGTQVGFSNSFKSPLAIIGIVLFAVSTLLQLFKLCINFHCRLYGVDNNMRIPIVQSTDETNQMMQAM